MVDVCTSPLLGVTPSSFRNSLIRARAPWYLSDWTGACNYRVIPATTLIIFLQTTHLIETTHQYGVTEILVSSFMAAFIFSVFGAQPLTIPGKPSQITDIIQKQPNPPNYLRFVGWVYFWAAIGVQVITRQFSDTLLMLVIPFLFQALSKTDYLHQLVRLFFPDYGMPISLICCFWHGILWGHCGIAHPATLPVGSAFQAANRRELLVGHRIPFDIVLWVLFFFYHNVLPPGFYYGLFLFGIITFIVALIGVPAPNGLIPQAPIRMSSLVVMGHPSKESDGEGQTCNDIRDLSLVPIGVVEQRVSNLAQGDWYTGALSKERHHPQIALPSPRQVPTPFNEPLRKVCKSRLVLFVAIQLVGFGATFAITQTIATIGFPVVVLLLVLLRTLVILSWCFVRPLINAMMAFADTGICWRFTVTC
ncbi:hypothetical protein EV363DRAFT_1399069 [Boletus edulis]|nr:hypothetical protein EV363DRAFT_1399069 [Boletus edulis]